MLSPAERKMMLRVEKGRGHSLAVACLGPIQLKRFMVLVRKGYLRVVEPNAHFRYERLVVTSDGSHALGTFDSSHLEYTPPPRRAHTPPAPTPRKGRTPFAAHEKVSVKALVDTVKRWPWSTKTLPYSEFKRRVRSGNFSGASERLIREAYRAAVHHYGYRRKGKISTSPVDVREMSRETNDLSIRIVDHYERLEGMKFKLRTALRQARQIASTGASGRFKAKQMLDGWIGQGDDALRSYETFINVTGSRVKDLPKHPPFDRVHKQFSDMVELFQDVKSVRKEMKDYRFGALSS